MVFALASARTLYVRDEKYGREFILDPFEAIYDPYLLDLIQRARIGLKQASVAVILKG